MPEIKKTFYARNRKEWRDWLKKNHLKEKNVFLVKYKKHTKKPSLTHKEAMEEAICFGWIDTTIKKLDEDRYGHHFVRRNKNSRWSNNTLSYAKKLAKDKKMSKYGLKMYKEGLKKPVIDHGLPRNPKTPKDLIKALEKNEKAKDFFKSLAPSYKRTYIYWIEMAKREETRKNRIKRVIKNFTEKKKQIF